MILTSGLTRSALCVPPGRLRAVPDELTKNGRPDMNDAIANFEGEGGMVYGPTKAEPSDPQVVKDVLDAVQK